MTARLEKRIAIQSGLLGDVLRNVPLELREQSAWDWAACLRMASRYYAGDDATPRQCEMVNEVIGRVDCCGSRAGSPYCNLELDPADIGGAFARYRMMAIKAPNQPTAREIPGYLNSNQLLLAQLESTYQNVGRTYWLALIIGSGASGLTINDPGRGQLQASYQYLSTGYGQPGGEWVSTWLVARKTR